MRNIVTKGLVITALGILCMSLASPAHAWDHKRKGFILGGALGGMGIYDAKDDNGFGWLVGDIKIGYAPLDRLVIYYTSRNLVTPGIMGGLSFGADYYMKQGQPTLFFKVGSGRFGGTNPWAYAYHGYSIYTGVGYEFARHWAVAMEVGYTDFEWFDESDRDWDYDGVDLRVLIGLTGY